MRQRRLVMILGAAALLLGACGGGTADGEATDTGSASEGSFVGMLRLIPDTEGNRVSVMMEDIAAVRDALGISPPADPGNADRLLDYVMTITQGPVSDASSVPVTRSPGVFLGVFLGGSQFSPFEMTEWPDEMGLSITEFDADLLAGLPPDTLTIWMGSLDPGRIATAVASDPVWSGDLEEQSHAGLDHWCWGDDPARVDVERRTPMRPLGRGGCLAAFEGTAYRTITIEAMEAALEVRAGNRTSLADIEALRRAADALEDAGAYAAAFTMEAERFGSDAAQLDQPLVEEWTAMGAGAGFDEEGSYLVLVLVYGDDATASANAATLETIAREGRSVSLASGRPWSQMYDSLGPVTSDGPVVVARFYGEAIARRWPIITGVIDTLTMWSG